MSPLALLVVGLWLGPPCQEPAARPERDRGIDSLLQGQPHAAQAQLSQALRARPRDRAAEALRAVALERLVEEQRRAAAEVTAAGVVALAALPFDRPPPEEAAKPLLTRESQRPNVVVDPEDWLARNGLTNTVLSRSDAFTRVPSHEPPPGHVAVELEGEEQEAVFRAPDHDVALYEERLVVSAPGKRPRVYDLALARKDGSHQVSVASSQLVGKRLIVQFGHAWKGDRSGFLAAFDAEGGQVLWMTESLVGGSNNFVVTGDAIVTGYGSQGEPDALNVIDLGTGAVRQRLPLKTAPEMILRKGDRIFVRSYNTDGIYRAAGPLPPAPPAALEPGAPMAGVAIDRAERCHLRAAANAADRRDAAAVRAHAAVLRDPRLAAAVGALATPPALDLTALEPLVVGPVPWAYAAPAPRPLPQGAPPVFSRRLAQERIPYERPKKPRFVPGKPLRGLWGVVPEGAPAGIPARYGLEPLNAIIPSGERLLLIYGGRHVFSVIQGRVEKAFDLAALLHPPDPGLRDAHYAEQDLLFAEVAGDTLYACNAGDVFAQFVRDRKGHLTALDFATGQLLWRSEPRTCSSMFLVVGDYLISAYGEAIKDNQAVLVRRADGQRLGKVTIRDAEPEELILEGRRLILVDGFRRHVFELREATAP